MGNGIEKNKGRVKDPETGEIIKWDGQVPRPWDMGHMPSKEFIKLRKKYERGEISWKEFYDEYNNPNVYRPELPTPNRRRNRRQ